MAVKKTDINVGKWVKLDLTQKSRLATGRTDGTVDGMFENRPYYIIEIIGSKSVKLDDGYDYSIESIKKILKRKPIETIYVDIGEYEDCPGIDGILYVGCQKIKITQELIDQLNKIKKG